MVPEGKVKMKVLSPFQKAPERKQDTVTVRINYVANIMATCTSLLGASLLCPSSPQPGRALWAEKHMVMVQKVLNALGHSPFQEKSHLVPVSLPPHPVLSKQKFPVAPKGAPWGPASPTLGNMEVEKAGALGSSLGYSPAHSWVPRVPMWGYKDTEQIPLLLVGEHGLCDGQRVGTVGP